MKEGISSSPLEKEVWVFAEQEDGELAEVSLELLGEGQGLAGQLRANLGAVLIGNKVTELVNNLAHYGARKVYLAEDESLKQCTGSACVDVIAGLIREHAPSIFLFGSTPRGRELAPTLAARVKGAFAADCTIFDISNQGRLVLTRPIHGGKLDAKYVFLSNAVTQIATVRPGLIGLEKPDTSRRAEIIRVNVVDKQVPYSRIIGLIKGDPRSIDIREAEIIVGIGKGVGGMRNLRLIEELADTLGASLGGTRLAVDMGWVSRERMVGQTGKYVSPKLYIACGISGAREHVQGMKNSKHIIAINTDRNAPIFKIAHIGIVGDLGEVVPAITQRVRQLASSGQVAKADT